MRHLYNKWFKSWFAPLLLCGLASTISCRYVEKIKAKLGSRQTATVDYKDKDKKKSAYFPVLNGPLSKQKEWRGIVQAAQRIEIRADKRLKISQVQVKNDQWVKAGQLLIEIDNKENEKRFRDTKDRLASAAIEARNADINLHHAKKSRDRKASLLKSNVVAAKEFEEADKQFLVAETAVKSKRLEIERLNRELKDAEVQSKSANFRAPFDGIVSGLPMVVKGAEEINQGALLATVANPSQFIFNMDVDEADVVLLKAGQAVSLKLDAITKQVTNARILEIPVSPVADSSAISRKFRVQVAFDGVDSRQLKEGFEGKCLVVFEKRDKALTVPVAAVFRADGKDYVQIAGRKGGSLSQRRVVVGLRTDSEAEVIEGLREGDYVGIQAD